MLASRLFTICAQLNDLRRTRAIYPACGTCSPPLRPYNKTAHGRIKHLRRGPPRSSQAVCPSSLHSPGDIPVSAAHPSGALIDNRFRTHDAARASAQVAACVPSRTRCAMSRRTGCASDRVEHPPLLRKTCTSIAWADGWARKESKAHIAWREVRPDPVPLYAGNTSRSDTCLKKSAAARRVDPAGSIRGAVRIV